MKKFNIILFVLLLIAIALTAGVLIAKANPSYFGLTKETAAATTTVAYMTPGTATTTLVYDTYAAYSNTKTDTMVLGLQFVGSTTNSTLGIRYEYSSGFPGRDCVTLPLSCDWYSYGVNDSAVATSTYVSNYLERVVLAASSTPGGRTAPINGSLELFDVPAPTRFVRAVIYSKAGNGSVWAQFIPVKERTE